jgi:hypothetical protein
MLYRVLVAAGVALSAGCSAMIAGSGLDLGLLTTREQVHAAMGEPVATGTTDGRCHEDFRSHRKIAEPWQGEGLVMVDYGTLGLAEFVLFPAAILRVGYTAVVGEDVRFQYDATGKVTACSLDGEPFRLFLFPTPADATADDRHAQPDKSVDAGKSTAK